METRYNHKEIESKWLENWNEQENFKPSNMGAEHFSIVIPPPNVTGALHLGHALNNTIQDILIRYNRKLGKNTLWIPGTDHAGIATQAVVEKRLLQEEKKTRHDLGREELVKRIWKWKDEYEARITNQLKSLGASCDWSKQRFTLDPICAKAVRYAFFNLFKKGLIYRGKRLVNWDTHLRTAVADDEIYHETVKGHFWTFKYPLADGSGYIPVATTRPETILGDTAVAVHPEDERYKKFIGKTLLVPFVNREIPVIADAVLVDMDFGTGSVKVTPAHDPNDYETGLRHKLPMLNILNEDGSLNENAGEFKGLKGEKARAAVVEGLEKQGLLLKVEDHEMQIGKSDRPKTVIEPYLSDQWFVKMDALAERAMQAVESGEVKFTPARYAKNYLNWLGEKRDWCISRQLWWGHQIPIWYASARPNINRSDIHCCQTENGDWLLCSLEEDLDENSIEGLKLVRDPDVLDTWFSSALWPHSTMGWPGETDDLKNFYPTSVLVTARDIISLWVARMVIFSQENMGEIPFSNVYINPTILDGSGRRMSKSHGNGVDPLDIIEKYGADSLRFVMCSVCTENQEARLPVKKEKLEDGREINVSEKFEIGRNFGNKLWNAARFLKPYITDIGHGTLDMGQEKSGKSENRGYRGSDNLEDKWILSKLNTVVKETQAALENYRFSEYASLIYHFVWDDLCSRYLEIKKGEISKESSALLSHSLYTVLDLLHPIMPFITEELNAILFPNSERVILREWPSADESLINAEIEKQFEEIFAIVEAIRSVRGRYSIAPAQKIAAVVHTAVNLESCKSMITDLSGLSSFEFGENLPKPAFSANAVISGGEVFVPLEGILNKETEIARLKKEIEKAESFIVSLNKKLSNENFVKGAPAAIIEGEHQKLATQRDIVEKCKAALEELFT
ncbi:MAG: valine--tRNA ligase [Fibromonadaceae bacterium]|jgi:valyl-tRNA synthetase|nr:valine--tRNA ligase [Fibromonadaceae bacterium]